MTFKLFDERFRAPTAMVGISLFAVLAAGCTAIFSKRTSEKIRLKIVQAAINEPWTDPPVTKYWKDVLTAQDFAAGPPKEWCGGFDLWALHQAGVALDTKWIVGTGFLFKLPTTINPKRGDIAYFQNQQHHALVRNVIGNKVDLINGNGAFGKITPSSTDRIGTATFYDVEPFIQKAIG
jgi:hypothetical protein